MPVAISYFRFSHPSQADGNSEDRQDENFKQALIDLKEYKLTPGEVFFDRGKSAYHGKHKEGELGKILAMVKAGLFPKDCWLIIEAFDRLTRQGIDETQQLVRQIILGGVTIYICADRMILDRAALNDVNKIIRLAIRADIAHKESAEKSRRIKRAWKERVDTGSKTNLITKKIPLWCRLVNGKIKLIPVRAAIIRQIFKWRNVEGMGENMIVKRLIKEKIPAWGKRRNGQPGIWSGGYIHVLLSSRAMLGEHHSTLGNVIPKYYPPVVTKDDFAKAQAIAAQAKKWHYSKSGLKIANLFKNLAFDEAGENMVVETKGKGHTVRFVSSTDKQLSFPYAIFEEQFLRITSDLSLADIGRTVESNSELTAVEKELIELENRIAETQQALDEVGGNVASVVRKLAEMETKKEKLAGRRDKLKSERHLNTAEQSLANCRTILEALQAAKGQDLVDMRLRLRQAIRGLVSRMTVSIERDGWDTKLFCLVTFASGHRRMFSILTRRGELHIVISDHAKWKEWEYAKRDREVMWQGQLVSREWLAKELKRLEAA